MRFTFRGPLLRFVNFEREVTAEGPTVAASLSALCAAYPQLHPVLFDAEGEVRGTHRLFLDGCMITKSDLSRPVSGHERVEVLTAIAGG
jgi:molybdopterin converting factor small subunit